MNDSILKMQGVRVGFGRQRVLDDLAVDAVFVGVDGAGDSAPPGKALPELAGKLLAQPVPVFRINLPRLEALTQLGQVLLRRLAGSKLLRGVIRGLSVGLARRPLPGTEAQRCA